MIEVTWTCVPPTAPGTCEGAAGAELPPWPQPASASAAATAPATAATGRVARGRKVMPATIPESGNRCRFIVTNSVPLYCTDLFWPVGAREWRGSLPGRLLNRYGHGMTRSPRVRRPATLASLAAELGVSRTTVSNAYNRPDQLSVQLRTRVLETARR